MLAPSLADLAICVDSPSAWLGRLVVSAQGRLHRRTPRDLARVLRPFLSGDAPDGQPRGWLTSRVFDGQAHPPLLPGDRLEAGDWIVEFSFARRSWTAAIFGVGTRSDKLWKGLEARARAFLDADLREVEQWALDGFPELCVTLGRAGDVALRTHAQREAVFADAVQS